MKNHKNTIDPIDEALRFIYLNANSEKNVIDASSELSYIVESKYPEEISSDKANQLVNSLYEKLAVDSFGILISKSLEKGNISVGEIAMESNLPIPTIEQLQIDAILANSIPVISFKTLLRRLQIPFDKAKQSIIKTFHILKNEMSFSPSPISAMHLSYRRRNIKGEAFTYSKADKKEGQYLFQNEEALIKYLNRLGELCTIE